MIITILPAASVKHVLQGVLAPEGWARPLQSWSRVETVWEGVSSQDRSLPSEAAPCWKDVLTDPVADFGDKDGGMLENNTSFELATSPPRPRAACCQQPGATLQRNNMARKFYGLRRALADTKKLIIYSDLL